MHAQIRRVGMALLVLLLAVFVMLNYVQIYAAGRIASNPANSRILIREYSIKRGDIVTSDGVTVASSRATGGDLKYRREYPEGDLYGHITGFYSLVYGATRIEASYNDELLGDSGVISMQDIQDRLFGSGEEGDDVILTVNDELQQASREALADNTGAVVAMDPNNGGVLAMWSNPSFDPSPLATHRPPAIRRAYQALDPDNPAGPMVSIATSRSFPPGSAFKVVTAAAALESGRFRPDSTFDDPISFQPPQTTDTISNFSGGTCLGGGQITLADALRVSCNTTFARIGLEVHNQVAKTAEALGLNQKIPFDVGTGESTFLRANEDNLPRRALSGIGQGDVSVTPLQMALVASTVANGGELVRPHLVKEIMDASGGIISTPSVETERAISGDTADELTDMMVAVVESGTGVNAQIEGVQIAGKTGTAQTVEGAAPHAWFIAFAPADDPQLAVCVFVQNGGSFGAEATGGTVAAPIAREIIELDREIRGW